MTYGSIIEHRKFESLPKTQDNRATSKPSYDSKLFNKYLEMSLWERRL
jgi:hypothetical protein